jgi:hypothetical protein
VESDIFTIVEGRRVFMKKYLFCSLCIIFSLFIHSCEDFLNYKELEYFEIKVINLTTEKIEIYYMDLFFGRLNIVMIDSNENRLIKVRKNRIYYAEGRNSKKQYGSSSFFSYNVWYIK